MGKDSIRKKIEELKDKSQKTLSGSDVSPEIKSLIDSFLLIIDIMVMVFLEKKIRKNSGNSGLPPSKDFGSNGNRNNNTTDQENLGEQLNNTRHVETEETTTPENCSKCGIDLTEVPVKNTEERKLIDILYEITTHTVIAEIKVCPGCGHVNKGPFPAGMDGEMQYGMGIKAAIINYLLVQMMSLQRVQEHFMGLIGRLISQATMLKYIFQIHISLEKWEQDMIEKIILSPVIHCDETSIRVNKKNYWIHVYTYGDISLQFIHSKRGIEAVQDINIIPRYGGIIVHDCWSTYFYFKDVNHALCGAHILRELRYIEECNGYGWATMMKDLLKEAAEVVSGRISLQVLYADEYKKLEERYREILEAALLEMPPFTIKEEGKKGAVKHTDAENLWLRLKKYENSVLMFARIKEVNFTNNRAERDIRCSKTKQKVSGGFRTFKYAQAYVRITSYIKTLRYRGYSSLQAINLAMNGNIPQ
jgi:transposase